MKNPKILVSFADNILTVKFLDSAVIDAADLDEIYAYGAEMAKGKKYGIIFKALNSYEVTDEAINFLSDNPYTGDILAKAYVINTKEVERKTKFHLLFDNPALKPYTFSTTEEGIAWLKSIMNNS